MEVLVHSEDVTVVPADFYDELVASLDEPDVPNEALVRAASRRASRLPSRVLRLVYEPTATGWAVSSPDIRRLADSAPTLDELKRRVDARLADWLGDHIEVEVEVSGRFSGADC